MRERSEPCAAQRGGARGGARTMARWLWATVLMVVLALAGAEHLPGHSLPSLIRVPRHARGSLRHLHILGWHLELQENRAIRSPYYNECQFYKGRVLHKPASTVTVTECEGQLYGLLQVDGEDFVLQPTRADGSSHVLRRRDVLLSEQPATYNLTGDTVVDLDIDFADEELSPVMHVYPRHTDHSDVDYFRNMITPVTRPVSGVCRSGGRAPDTLTVPHMMLYCVYCCRRQRIMARISYRCGPYDVEIPRSGKGETLYLSYNEHRKYIS